MLTPICKYHYIDKNGWRYCFVDGVLQGAEGQPKFCDRQAGFIYREWLIGHMFRNQGIVQEYETFFHDHFHSILWNFSIPTPER